MKVSIVAAALLLPTGVTAFFPTLLAAANGYLSQIAGGPGATVMKPPSYGVSKYNPKSPAPDSPGYLSDLTKNTGYPSLSQSVASMQDMAQAGSSSGAGYLSNLNQNGAFSSMSAAAPAAGANGSYLDALKDVAPPASSFSSFASSAGPAAAAGNYLSAISRGGSALKPPSKRMWSPRDGAPRTGGYLDNLVGSASFTSSFSAAPAASSWSPPAPAASYSAPAPAAPAASSWSAAPAATSAPPASTSGYLGNIGGSSSSSSWGRPRTSYTAFGSSYRMPSGQVGSTYLNSL